MRTVPRREGGRGSGGGGGGGGFRAVSFEMEIRDIKAKRI